MFYKKTLAHISALFTYLARFCFALATVFPGTATVEVEFSVVNREASVERVHLSDLSLQGILFANQWKQLRNLNIWAKN